MFDGILNHIKFMQYTMIKNFNISLKELNGLDLNFVYDMYNFFRREEKSKEFLNMALAGVDLKKSDEYRKFIQEDIVTDKVDMSGMEDIKEMSLKLLKGGKNG